MQDNYKIKIIDTHAGGDISRIVVDGIKDLKGNSVREKMEYIKKYGDGLRKLLLFEPYGIPEMSVDLIVPSTTNEAVAGYIIMEVMGYPIYSGSNTICTATAVLESGIVEKNEGVNHFKLESPAGLVDIKAIIKNSIVESITCEGLPSYIIDYKQKINIPGFKQIEYSIAYSGGFYILVNAKELGFDLVRQEETNLASYASLIVEEINKKKRYEHYDLGFVGEIPFLHFMGELERRSDNHYISKSTTYVHPGVICRSTTGTGTSARLALLNHENKLKKGDKLETISLRDTRFVGEIIDIKNKNGTNVVKNSITGKSYILAKSDIMVNCTDPMLKDNDLCEIMDVD
ncbi:MAG: proline racemase family protein [Campylobacterota bacterium]